VAEWSTAFGSKWWYSYGKLSYRCRTTSDQIGDRVGQWEALNSEFQGGVQQYKQGMSYVGTRTAGT
jgi:hypothetical protein